MELSLKMCQIRTLVYLNKQVQRYFTQKLFSTVRACHVCSDRILELWTEHSEALIYSEHQKIQKLPSFLSG